MNNRNLKDKTVLVTGATGFIGVALIKRLIKEEARVHMLYKDSAKLLSLGELGVKISKHKVGLEEPIRLRKAIKQIQPQVIFHLAAYGTNSSQKDFSQMVQTNIVGTINLLNSLKDINYEIFINTGSSSEYGIKEERIKEGDILSPVNLYAVSKASATLVCQTYSRVFSKPIITLRPFSVYGPGQDQNQFIPTIIKKCLLKEQIVVSSADYKRDFVFVDDLVEAYIKASHKNGLAGKVINISTGEPHSIETVVKKIIKLMNKFLTIKYENKKVDLNDIPYWVGDNSLARKLLGWRPKISLEEGMEKTIEWFSKNKFQEKLYDR